MKVNEKSVITKNKSKILCFPFLVYHILFKITIQVQMCNKNYSDRNISVDEKGDLLIFLSGISEITAVVDAAKEYSTKKNNWIVLPLHSTLSIIEQDKVYFLPRYYSNTNHCVHYEIIFFSLFLGI